MSITTEESQQYASIMNDINTLISESVVPSLRYQVSDEFDDFVNMVKSLRIDDAIAIQQALNRYNALNLQV